jgi:hypothetical protein
MEVSVQLHAPFALTQRTVSGTYLTGGYMDHRAGLDVVGVRGIFSLTAARLYTTNLCGLRPKYKQNI